MRFILLLPVMMLILSSCGGERVKPAIDKNLNISELPAQESWNSTVYFSDSGKTKAVLTAGHIRMFEESRETLIDSNLKVDFYNPYEVKTTTLISKRGKVNDVTKDLYAIDSVVAVNDSGMTLLTDELMWRNTDRKIVSEKFVTILTPKERIEGYGFESDQGLRNYVIYNITYVTRRDTLQP